MEACPASETPKPPSSWHEVVVTPYAIDKHVIDTEGFGKGASTPPFATISTSSRHSQYLSRNAFTHPSFSPRA